MLEQKYTLTSCLAFSPRMKEFMSLVQKVSESQTSVLICGESGVGKEWIAKTIHANGSRADRQFLGINCGAVPENLLESELFGYMPGAFTGADNRKTGLFEQADGGTLLLDEVGDMPLSMQVKILRVLENGEFTPLGSTEPIKVDVRVICATNKNLMEMIALGTFREDLFYRMSVFTLDVPTLRERKKDIPHLISYALKKFSVENQVSVKELDDEALSLLVDYQWPGNIRELMNVIYNLCFFVEKDLITKEDILKRADILRSPHDHDQDAEWKKSLLDLTHRIEEGELTLSDAKKEFEKIQISRALHLHDGKIAAASRFLQMPRPQVSRLVKKYQLK